MYNAKRFDHSYTEARTIASKNGVDLREVVRVDAQTVSHYEIYVDGAFWTKYTRGKEARRLWKDFSAAA